MSLDETLVKYQTDSAFDNLKFSSDVTCHDRRMRELTKDQFDHETAQRDFVENGGSVPSGTNLMGLLNA